MYKTHIERIKKEIEFLKQKETNVDEELNFIYQNKFEDINYDGRLFPYSAGYKQERIRLENLLKLYEALTNEKIDLNKGYCLTNDIYLRFNFYKGIINPYFCLEDDTWVHDYYIGSWSGITTWINHIVQEEFDLYNNFFGYLSCDLNNLFLYIQDEKRPFEDKISFIKMLINLVEGNGMYKELKDCVSKNLDFKLNEMKKLINE